MLADHEFTHDPDARVRDAVVIATGYLPWPQVRDVLKQLVEHDTHPAVREDAAAALSKMDEAGVPEERSAT